MKSIILNDNGNIYPFLGKYISKRPNESFIVLFSKDKTGTVVALEENQRCHKLGHYSEEWNMNCFEKFKGEIKLSN